MTRAATGLALAAALLASACVAGPDYARPQLDAPERYASAPQDQAPLEGAARATDPWWAGFQDADLSALVDAVLVDNLSLAQAAERLVAAEALAGAAQSDFLPTLDGSGSVSARTDGDAGALVGLSAAQVVDTNGRLRRASERARAELLAARFSLDDARRLTVASVVRLYVEHQRADARLALLDASLDLQQRTLYIVERRAEAGLSADLDVQRAMADLARTRAQRGGLTLQQARARNQLAVLLGQPSASALDRLGVAGEAGAGADIALGLAYVGPITADQPADLLRRRPDLRAAEARLMAATAEIGVQAADLYPSLRLPGSISLDLSDGAGDHLAASLAAVIDIPILDFGRRQAELTAAEANAAAAALAYREAFLTALQDVETGFVAIDSVEARRTDLGQAVAAGEQAFDQLNALYREGLASFIDVLDAQRTLIDSREALVDSEADLAAAIIDLQLALAAPN